MYIIGSSYIDFAKIDKIYILDDNLDCNPGYLCVEYNHTLKDATMYSSLDDARKIIKKIREEVEEIYFKDGESCLDLQIDNFDKYEYVENLKIFRIEPELV